MATVTAAAAAVSVSAELARSISHWVCPTRRDRPGEEEITGVTVVGRVVAGIEDDEEEGICQVVINVMFLFVLHMGVDECWAGCD